jgi:hypothetical protein
MNSSLHEIQNDIQRLATQQHQIQDLPPQHHLQGLLNQQQHQIQVKIILPVLLWCKGFALKLFTKCVLHQNYNVPWC